VDYKLKNFDEYWLFSVEKSLFARKLFLDSVRLSMIIMC